VSEREIMAAIWPKGVRRVSQDELDRLGIDEEEGRLYFDGKEVAIRSGFFLLPLERWIAIVAAGAALTTALVNLAKFFFIDTKCFGMCG
jgi:hypothetical protein